MIHFAKSPAAPPCLETEKAKAKGDYKCGNVLELLKTDFKNKCYLCEVKEPHSINVEHFRPHKKKNKDLEFDWNNLFYCCGHCNNTKLAKPEYDEILNCTIETDGVDTKIKYEIKPYPKEKAIITALENEPQVNNTVNLLDEIYNGRTILKKIESANIRSKLLFEIRVFQDLLIEFFDDGFTQEEREEIKNKISRHLKPASNFTAFKRWIIRGNEELLEEFGEFV